MLSRSTPEYAVRRIVSAISSAIDSKVLRKSSKPMGSEAMSDHLPVWRKVDDDVAMCIERRARVGRHHAGRIVLLHDEWSLARRLKVRPVGDRGVAPAEIGAEVHAPAPAGTAGPGAIDAQCVRHARAVGDAEPDHAKAHDLHRLVLAGAVAVRALVLPSECLIDAVEQRRVERPARHGHGELERLPLVAAVGRATDADRVGGKALGHELSAGLALHPAEDLAERLRLDAPYETTPGPHVMVLDVGGQQAERREKP